MRWLSTISVLLWLSMAVNSAFAQTNPKRPNANAPAVAAQDMIMAFYVNRMPTQLELSDEQFAKVLPFLRQWLMQRRMVENRRARAINQLQQAVNNNAPESELARLTQEADEAEAERVTIQQKFLTSVDPLLTSRQKARLRVFQVRTDEQISRLIEQSRNRQQLRQSLPNKTP